MMTRIIPEEWMPQCQMRRIITHWTAGGHRATKLDRQHYHILIEGDGRLVRGVRSIQDNVNTRDRAYAAHTLNCNAGSIGVSVCCMANATEAPFRPGLAPMRQKQYEVLTVVVADLCDCYGIDVTATTVLGHGEVQANLRIKQRQKWDPMVLPWDKGLSKVQVGNAFRERVRSIRMGNGLPLDPEQLLPVRIVLDGEELTDEGILQRGASWCPLRLLAVRKGWKILEIDSDSALLATPEIKEVEALTRDSRGFVQVRDLCAKMGWPAPVWTQPTRTISVESG